MILGSILVSALMVDFLFYSGFYASDDVAYLDAARGLVREGHIPISLGAARLGVIVPSAIVYALSGGSVAAVAWFHVLYHVILVILAFALGRLLHDELTGLLAAALAAMSPIFYVYAGAILPDNPTAVWLGLAMLLLELVRRRAAGDRPLNARAAFGWFFSIGLLLGFAYSCKETGLIMTVPAAVCVMAAAPRLRDPVWIRNGMFMAAGLIAFTCIELLVLRAASGEWCFRPALVGESADVFLDRMRHKGGANPLHRFEYALGKRLSPVAPVSIWVLLIGAAVYTLLRRRKLALIAFFWWPLLYVTVGTTSFMAYRPSSLQARYYAIVVLPAAVMAAAVAVALLERWCAWPRIPAMARRAATGALALIFGAVACYEVDHNSPSSGNIYAARKVRAFSEAFQIARSDYPQYPIVVGNYFRRHMRPILYDDPVLAKHRPEPPYVLLLSPDELGDGGTVGRLHPDVEAGVLAARSAAAGMGRSTHGDAPAEAATWFRREQEVQHGRRFDEDAGQTTSAGTGGGHRHRSAGGPSAGLRVSCR